MQIIDTGGPFLKVTEKGHVSRDQNSILISGKEFMASSLKNDI